MNETRVPMMTRLKRSRPNESVPIGWSKLGASKSPKSSTSGSWGASKGPKTETTTSTSTKANPTNAFRSRRNRRQKRPLSNRRGSVRIVSGRPAAPAVASLAIVNHWIKERIEDVDEEIRQNEHHSDQQNYALNYWVVLVEDRSDEDAPQTADRENRLDHHGAT